jgi:hypothetical protein
VAKLRVAVGSGFWKTSSIPPPIPYMSLIYSAFVLDYNLLKSDTNFFGGNIWQ